MFSIQLVLKCRPGRVRPGVLGILTMFVALVAQPLPGRAATFHPIVFPRSPADSSPARGNEPQASTLKFDNLPFRAESPLRLTGMADARQGRFFPPSIDGIAVGRKASVIHVLHAVDGPEKDGIPLASIVLHYAGGQNHVLRLAYGVHSRSISTARRDSESFSVYDANSAPLEQDVKNTNSPAASGSSIPGYYRSAFINPLPKEEIVSLSLRSLFSRATPTIAAITLEEGPDATPLRESRENRIVRKAREFDDAAYHREISVRSGAGDGRFDPSAEASLIVTDEEGSHLFGHARPDASGHIRLSVPAQQAAGIAVVVRSAGKVPFVYSSPKDSIGRLPNEIVARLESGSTGGGIVRSTAGEPVPGATITLFHLSEVRPREFNRLDYDAVLSDAAGKWSSSALPAALDGFQVAVAHPDYRPRVLSVSAEDASNQPGQAPAAHLREGRAEIRLEPALRLAGVIKGADGKPIAGAEIQLGSMRSSDSSEDRLVTRSGPDGRYKLSVVNAGSYGIIATADGYSPIVQPVAMREGAGQDLDLILRSGQVFVGRITDQSQQPVAGAKVRLESWNDTRFLKFETETDPEGRFVWKDAPEGQLRFYLSATNHSSTTYSISTGNAEQRFTLRKLSSVRGLVIDAETRKPIPDFSVYRGRAYNRNDPLRWERYNTFRGRNGEYNVRLVEYSSEGRTAVLIEAPGYMPVASEAFTRPGVYTNNFELKKARGVGGRVLAADGTPVSGATLALLEPGENAYLGEKGDLRRNSDAGLQARTDRNGEFTFAPRLDPHTVIASHEKGFAEVRVTNATAPLSITLQPWARIDGVVKIPPPAGRQHEVRLNNTFYRYSDDSRENQPLSLYVSAEVGPDGTFHFNRVPPGERRVSLYHSVRIGDMTRSANSHGLAVRLDAGQSTNIVIGAGGRPVVGRMNVVGGDPEDVDWKRDFHTLNLSRSINMNLPQLDFSKARTQEQQQELWAQQRKAEAAFWRTPAGMDHERGQVSYILQFETNGTFRVDGVPPGRYQINISPTDPGREDYSYEQIGNLNKEVVVPEGAGAFDLGELEIAVRGTMRVGKRAPRFTVSDFDGKEVRLESFRGKHVLIDFWATWAGTRNLDLQNLKAIRQRYAKDDRLVMIGMNLDHLRQQAEQTLKDAPLDWLQCYGGPWNESQIRVTYGLRGMPDAILIDPEGKVAALNLRGSNLLRTVQRLLGDPATPAR